MGRRQFLAVIAAILLLFGVRTEAPRTKLATQSDGILYWVVVGEKNPFAFGVKDDSEVLGFKKLRPGRYRTVEAARAACV